MRTARACPLIALLASAIWVALPPSAGAAPRCFGEPATRIGTQGRDVINLDNNRDDVIVTKGGNDRVETEGGKDLVCTGAGADNVDGGHKIDGGRGADHLEGFRSKIVFGAKGDDDIRGSSGLVVGGKGDDRVRGDQFYVETLIGGPGDDRIVAVSSFLEDLEEFDSVDYSTSDEGVVVDLQAGTASGDGNDTLVDVTHVSGSPFRDRMRGPDEVEDPEDDVLLLGRGGPDVLRAGDVPTDFDGGNGNDRLIGGPSDDFFEDDKGSDYMDGRGDADMVWYGNSPRGINLDLEAEEATGQGHDRIFNISEVVGSEFSDVLKGDDTDNYLDGDQLRQTKDDVLMGRGGEDLLFGKSRSDDEIYGGPGTDTLHAGFGEDLTVDLEAGILHSPQIDTRIFSIENVNGGGADKNLVLKGDDGPNRLLGSFSWSSRLVGRGGDDFLKGGEDDDDVGRGGLGTDTCEGIEDAESCEITTP